MKTHRKVFITTCDRYDEFSDEANIFGNTCGLTYACDPTVELMRIFVEDENEVLLIAINSNSWARSAAKQYHWHYDAYHVDCTLEEIADLNITNVYSKLINLLNDGDHIWAVLNNDVALSLAIQQACVDHTSLSNSSEIETIMQVVDGKTQDLTTVALVARLAHKFRAGQLEKHKEVVNKVYDQVYGK